MTKKDIFFGLLIVIALVVFIQRDFFFTTLPNKIWGPYRYKSHELRIVLNSPETSLSPYSLSLDDLIRTGNLYEGLVSFDRTLKIVPALAVTWGNIDPTTWVFKLRQEVVFHDGSAFNAQSVIQSLEAARQAGGAVKNLLQTVQDIKVVDPYTIHVITTAPDPLILSKLTKFFISKPGNIGTGSYTVKTGGNGAPLELVAFDHYWGQRPVYKTAVYQVTQNMTQRKTDFEGGLTDILVAVPKDQALELPKEQVKTSYSLEVNFMMFKLDDPLLSDRTMRENIRAMIDPARIEEIGNNFVRRVSQFVAPGVFGYNLKIPMFTYDETKRPKNLFGEQKMKISLDYLSTYKTLVEYLEKQFEDAGFLFRGNELTPEELLDKIKKNESQLYILGWQAENGDAGDFLDAFIKSNGEYNPSRYSNAVVDALIEKSRQELSPPRRLELLQKIMELVNDDLIGIPLFESSRLYAVKKGIQWEPRLDGLVLAKEVR